MSKFILSVNAGSSSLKLSLFSPTGRSASFLTLTLTASITSIAATPATFSVKSDLPNVETVNEKWDDVNDHSSAFERFLEFLESKKVDKNQIERICHRVVHGGHYEQPVVIDESSKAEIARLSDLAPLHNGPALSVITLTASSLPNAVSIAFFDTTFHRTIPRHISTYPINQTIAHERGLFKYGFHGISYAYIVRNISTHLHKPIPSLSLILLHLGSGASACAIRHGKSYDTSMGLTPVSGLPGATRSGAIDPSLIFHYTNKAGKITHDPSMVVDVEVTLAEQVLNKEAGWNAICGTKDFAEVVDKAMKVDHGEENMYRLAFDLFLDRISDYIGAYFVKLGGQVDALVFSGAIGEKSWQLRKAVCEKIECLGFQSIDDEANQAKRNGTWDIGAGTGKPVMVCETDEQYEMARECVVEHRFY